MPSTVEGERAGASDTTPGSGARRRSRPGRCLRDGVRSNQRANEARESTLGDSSSVLMLDAHVNHNARRPA